MKNYITPELELIRFTTEDVLSRSGTPFPGENETPIVPNEGGVNPNSVRPF